MADPEQDTPDTFGEFPLRRFLGMELSGDERAQLEDMKDQAQQLCAEGHETEGLDVTGEAKAMLNID